MNSLKSMAALLAVAATLLGGLPGQANASGLLRPNHVTIWNDRGGRMIQYALNAKRIQKAGKQVRFSGRCDSACTLYLGLPRSCISRNASFGFHLPYGSTTEGNRAAAQYMMRKYPGWVRSWIHSKGGLTNTVKTMPYSYAAKYIKPCGPASTPVGFGFKI